MVSTAESAASANLLLAERGVLTSDDTALDDGSLYDKHTFSGISGQQITIELESSEFDPYLILLDPQGKRISENDDISRSNRNSRLSITLPVTGEYTIIANSYEPGKSGTYSLQVSEGDSAISRQSNQRTSTPAIAQEMSTMVVPNSTPICDAAILSTMAQLKRDRRLNIFVEAVNLRSYFRNVPAARPNGISMGLDGPAALSVMFSPQLLTYLSSELVEECATVGAVFFNSAEAEFERVFGYLSGNHSSSAVSEFPCTQTQHSRPDWGNRMCL
ncbi:MAG: PPC domain-containing protein [Cyanobacteria bacterium P01_D01_bin.105]